MAASGTNVGVGGAVVAVGVGVVEPSGVPVGVTVEVGAVVGVDVYRDGAEVRVRAKAVVLTTGGYAAGAELFEELEGSPLVSAAARTSTASVR